MEQRRFPCIWRSYNCHLGYAFTTDGNGIALDHMRALLRLFNLLEDPSTYICIRAIAIAREFLENSAQFAHAFRAFFADEAAFNELHVGSMGHRHTKTLLDDVEGQSRRVRQSSGPGDEGKLIGALIRAEERCVRPAA